MKISIVVPVYNAEKHLNECIESVINQTSPDWELILIDDGSSDKSGEICDLYSQKHPDNIFVFHKENEGQFLTRKFGIYKCTGDYIGFLDADDILETNYIELLVANSIKYNFPDAVCFGFVQFETEITKRISVTDHTICFKNPEERKFVYNQIINGNLPGSLWSKMFKKDIVLKTIPDDTIVKSKRFAEDAYHSFDVLANTSSILYLDKTLYKYRIIPEGASQGFEHRNPDYFNSKYLYELLENNLEIMGLNDIESKQLLYTRNFNETVYFMLKFLRATNNVKRKKEIIDFDWTAYLLDGTIKEIEENPNMNKSYLNIWNAFRKKKYSKIFFREKIRKIIGW